MRDGRLDLPVDQASGLPNLAYTDEDFFRLEQQTLFHRSWVFAGFVHQFEKTGDMRPVEIGGQPVLLLRADDGCIRALHNVCSHRGACLVEAPKNAGKLVCPNHAWSYRLDGRLIARPHFHGGEKHDVNADECHRADLVEIRCITWHD